MEKIFQSAEEVLIDEQFQAWYFKTDPQKAEAWEQWMNQDPSRKTLVDSAIMCMQNIMVKEKNVRPEQVEASAQRLMDSLTRAETYQETPVVEMRSSRRRWWWSAAAAVILLLAGPYLWTNLGSKSSIQTAYGQVTQQQLPDGSEVILNANSSISYSSGWDQGKEREVWIKGEAFFKVKKTASKSRFIVHTDQLDVVVTGTQFNVVSRPDKSSVMLTEGSVIIRTKDGIETRMAPGDFVELANSQLARKAVKEETVLAWKDKKLFFDNTPLSLAVQKIKEHYGVEIIIVDGSLAEKTITGIVPNDNLDVLLSSLEATQEFKVVRNDGRITITYP
ncbi:MAG TPA: FecR domain-containing protein [Chitinophagaceae bacterium]|nr:FecR domain-containing protein [Chitinophagaceae bacterium]